MTALCHARSLLDIKKSKELRICIVPNHPSKATVEPASCKGECKFTGPIFEMSAAFAKSLGTDIHAKFIRIDLDEQYFNHKGKTDRDTAYTPALLASGKCDFYPNNLTKNEWRLKKLDFMALFPSRMMAIVAKSKQAQIKTVADLAGKTAAIEKDSSYHTWLQVQNPPFGQIQIGKRGFISALAKATSGEIVVPRQTNPGNEEKADFLKSSRRWNSFADIPENEGSDVFKMRAISDRPFAISSSLSLI